MIFFNADFSLSMIFYFITSMSRVCEKKTSENTMLKLNVTFSEEVAYAKYWQCKENNIFEL